MILCVDIGNTRVRCALGSSKSYLQAAVDTNKITDASCFAAFLEENFGSHMTLLSGGIYSSVVPQKNADILKAVKMINKRAIISPVNLAQMGIDFSGYKSAIGEDRAVCSWTGLKKYGAPVIVIDFGTATTINVINESNVYMGGAIFAGVQTGIDSLARSTARLPQLDLSGTGLADAKLIGEDTFECIVSGAIIGAAFAAEGYVRRIESLLDTKFGTPPTVIITGGNASKVIPYCGFDFVCEPTLLIEGLFWLYETAL